MLRVASFLAFIVLAGCGHDANGAPAAPAPSLIAPEPIPPVEASRAKGPCADIDYCKCTANPACQPRFTEGCVCSCDFRCKPEDHQCSCACGGAKFAACEPRP